MDDDPPESSRGMPSWVYAAMGLGGLGVTGAGGFAGGTYAALEDHAEMPGHPVMVERVERIERQFERMDARFSEYQLQERAQERNILRVCAHVDLDCERGL